MPAIDSDTQITLRKANLQDEDYLLNLRNEPVVRANSTRTYPLPKEYYHDWLSKVLADDKSLFFIAFSEPMTLPVGYFLFELKEPGYFLSYALNDYARGKNLSFGILQKALNLFFDEFEEAQLYAFVKKNNAISLRVLTKANFIPIVEDEDDEKILLWFDNKTRLK